MRSRILLIVLLLPLCFYSCKKSATIPPAAAVSIVGKWFLTLRNSKIYDNGVQTQASLKTNYSTNDFAQYFGDGTGIFSENDSPSPNLSAFKYTISGTNLVQFNSVITAGIPETITKLTVDSLWIHDQVLIVDPDNGDTETEVNDFDYKRAP